APIFDVFRGVETHNQGHRVAPADSTVNDQAHFSAHAQAFFQAHNIELLGAVQTQCLAVCTLLELQGQHAHAHQVGSVDTFKAFGHHGLHAQHGHALGGGIA